MGGGIRRNASNTVNATRRYFPTAVGTIERRERLWPDEIRRKQLGELKFAKCVCKRVKLFAIMREAFVSIREKEREMLFVKIAETPKTYRTVP